MPTCWSKSLSEDCRSLGHPWTSSCLRACIHFNAIYEALKIYAPIYSISFVISRKGKEYFKKKLFREIFQSSLFLASNGCFFAFYFCLFRKLFGRFHELSIGLLPGFFGALSAILIERKSRRGVLAVYMLNQACDLIFTTLKNSGYVEDIKYGEVVLFSCAMAVMMSMFSSGSLPDGFVKNILRKCFKNKDDSNLRSERESDFTALKNIIGLSGKVFCISSSLHTVYSIITYVPMLLKKPGNVYKALLKKENFEFGAWLGSYVFIYEAMLRVLEKYIKVGSQINAALAGGVAGISMLWHRKSSYALYIASKTLELMYMSGIEKGVVPYFKHFDSLLFACSTGFMFHVLMFQPLNLKPSYFKFLETLSGYKFIQFNREKMDAFGYDSSRINQLPIPNPWISDPKHAYSIHR